MPRIIKCSICLNSIQTGISLTKHLLEVHGIETTINTSTGVRICYCGKTVDNKSYSYHIGHRTGQAVSVKAINPIQWLDSSILGLTEAKKLREENEQLKIKISELNTKYADLLKKVVELQNLMSRPT